MNEDLISIKIDHLLERVLSVKVEIADIHNEIKTIQRMRQKEHKLVSDIKKKSMLSGKSNGFLKPVKVSRLLADFLDIPESTLIARTEVTSQIASYVREHKLYRTSDRRYFLTDEKMSELFSVENDTEISFYTLQTYLKPHYIKLNKKELISNDLK
jgi:chromatin remodeling complex protein RSC6